MAITRRNLFKFLGAAVIASPFIAASPALAKTESLFAVPLATTEPLSHGDIRKEHVLVRDIQPVYLGSEIIVPKVVAEFPTKPTKFDPLGEWGYVAWKVKLPNGEQYGNWLKISNSDGNMLDAYEYGVRFLDSEMKQVVKKLAPNVKVVTPAVNLQVKPGYIERVVTF